MRFPIESIRETILHENRNVRDFAMEYFSRSRLRDPLAFDYVIRAFDRYGFEDAFDSHAFDRGLHLTKNSFAWLLEKLNERSTNQNDLWPGVESALSSLLAWADIELLSAFEASLRKARFLDEETRTIIAGRLELRNVPAEECWNRLLEIAGSSEPEDHEPRLQMAMLEMALAPFREEFSERVLEILSRNLDADVDADVDAKDLWLERIAINLAGEFQLSESVPLLVDKIDATTDAWFDEITESLCRIGTDQVIECIESAYEASKTDFRFTAGLILGRVKSQRATEGCTNLFLREADRENKATLALALLEQWEKESLMLVYDACVDDLLGRRTCNVDDQLVIAASAMGVSLPGFEAWSVEMEAQKSEWRENNENVFAVMRKAFSEFEERLMKKATVAYTDPPSRPTVQQNPAIDNRLAAPRPIANANRVGRNEPCPCGSGRKFKKCCLNQRSLDPLQTSR